MPYGKTECPICGEVLANKAKKKHMKEKHPQDMMLPAGSEPAKTEVFYCKDCEVCSNDIKYHEGHKTRPAKHAEIPERLRDDDWKQILEENKKKREETAVITVDDNNKDPDYQKEPKTSIKEEKQEQEKEKKVEKRGRKKKTSQFKKLLDANLLSVKVTSLRNEWIEDIKIEGNKLHIVYDFDAIVDRP